MERLEVLERLAARCEGDRPTDHLLDAQGGATPGVTVQLGDDQGIQSEAGMEGLRRRDRVLPGHGVDDQEGVVGLQRAGDLGHLGHEVLVDGQATGRIADHHVATEAHRLGQAGSCHRHRIGRLAEHGHVDTATERPQLLDGSGTQEVGTYQHGVPALALVPAGQLGGSRRLAGSL